MRSVFVIPILMALPLAGCLDVSMLDTEPVALADALDAHSDIEAWFDESTTTDPDAGIHWNAEVGNWTYRNGTPAERPRSEPRFLQGPPFLLGIETLQGRTDWDTLYALLSSGGIGHYEYHDLLYRAITGKFFPEHYDDGLVDGVAPYWIFDYAASWASDHQDAWSVRWDGTPNWGGGALSGAPMGICPDVAAGKAWIGSETAFEKASYDPDFAAVVAAGGTVWLRLTVQDAPGFDIKSGLVCAEEPTLLWRVQAMDLDGLIEGAGDSVVIWVDATDSALRRRHMTTLRHPDTYTWTTAFSAQDTLVASPESPWRFEVPEGQVRLSFTATALPGAGVSIGDAGTYTLTAPSGQTYVVDEFAGHWREGIADPEPGTWTLSRDLVSLSTAYALRSITVETLS